MKKVLFLLMFPVLCFGQGDFRKMNWGQSVEDLKTAYPEEQFEKGIDIGCDIYIHSGDLIGIEAQIVYVFSDNKLIAGMYYLDPLNEFKRINQNILNLNFNLKLNKFFKLTDINKLISFMKNDKKNNNSKINLILLNKIGNASIKNSYDQKKIRNFLYENLNNI